MAKQLKISADTSEVRKSILDLSKTMRGELGKSKVELFTGDTRKFLKTEAVKGANELKNKIDKIKGSVEAHHKALMKVQSGSKEELKLKEKILRASQKIADLEKERGRLSQAAGTLGTGRGRGMLGQLGGGIGGAMGRGGLLGRAAGMLGRVGPLGLAAAGVAGAGMYGFSRARAGFRTFERGIPDRLRLRGRGLTGTEMTPEQPERLSRAGLNALTMRQRMLEGMDVFGRQGATQEAVMRRAEFERGFGLEGGTLSGIGAGMRQTLGGEGANKAVMEIQASLIASGIRDEIGPFLETAANMLVQLNERGFTFDQSAMTLFNRLLEDDDNIERMGRLVSNVDEAIRGSTGEANAFFQTAFGNAGIGGGTIGGAQAAIRTGGLFGADLGQYGLLQGTADEAALREMGIGGQTMQKVAQSTVGLLDQMFGREGDIERQLESRDPGTRKQAAQRQLSRQRFIMRTFGAQNEAEAGEINQMLRRAADPTTTDKEREKIKKELQNIKAGNTELGNLKDINSSTAGTLNVLENSKLITEDQIGEKVAPAMVTMRDTLLNIDRAIMQILGFLGVDTVREQQAEGLAGEDVLSPEDVQGITGGDKQKTIELGREMTKAQREDTRRMLDLREQATSIGQDGLARFKDPKKQMEYDMLQKRIQRRQETMDVNPNLQFQGLTETERKLETVRKKKQAAQDERGVFGSIMADMKSVFTGAMPDKELQQQQLQLQKQLLEELKKQNQTSEKIEGNTKNASASVKAGTAD